MNSLKDKLAQLTPEQRKLVLAKLSSKQSLSGILSSLTIEKTDRTGHIPLSCSTALMVFG
jgi:hypothetical protein